MFMFSLAEGGKYILCRRVKWGGKKAQRRQEARHRKRFAWIDPSIDGLTRLMFLSRSCSLSTFALYLPLTYNF